MAGSLSLAMSQVSDVSGAPLAGALLYFFQVGTVATPQNSYSDFGLTLVQSNPLVVDQYGRIPNFYLADGQVHVRLTDADGVVIFDYPSLQVLGPSSGGGGGGGSVDPTAIFSTGDPKWRATTEILTGWVKQNATTIGNATSGAAQRANADTLNLFTYLWTNFSNTKCPVTGGRGASAAADFAASKKIQVPDMRGRGPMGLDDMGGTAANRIAASNVTSGGGDNATTPAATGGEANHTLTVAEAPTGLHTLHEPSHSHAYHGAVSGGVGSGGIAGANESDQTTTPITIGITLTDNAGGQSHNNMGPFTLGTWYIKL